MGEEGKREFRLPVLTFHILTGSACQLLSSGLCPPIPATKCCLLLLEAPVDFSHLSVLPPAFCQSIQMCHSVTVEKGKTSSAGQCEGFFPGDSISWKSLGTRGWKPNKMNSRTSNLQYTVLLLLATGQLSFAFLSVYHCITGALDGIQGFVHKGAVFGTRTKQPSGFRWKNSWKDFHVAIPSSLSFWWVTAD